MTLDDCLQYQHHSPQKKFLFSLIILITIFILTYLPSPSHPGFLKTNYVFQYSMGDDKIHCRIYSENPICLVNLKELQES